MQIWSRNQHYRQFAYVGAGNGFTATRLGNADRRIIPLEPDRGMIDSEIPLQWVRGVAQELPFLSGRFAGAYATFAYFFPSYHGFGNEGLQEVGRVVSTGGRIAIADNAGDDEISSMLQRNIAGDSSWWYNKGFERTVVTSHFKFDTMEQAGRLMSFYWEVNGRAPGAEVKLEMEMKVAVYERMVS